MAYFTPCSTVSIVNFEHVNSSRESTRKQDRPFEYSSVYQLVTEALLLLKTYELISTANSSPNPANYFY